MRIALLADIHGNLPALAAVMDELERLQPDQVVINGDLINGVPFSPAVIDQVRAQNWVVVRGNHEFYYLDFGTPRAEPGTEDPQRWGQLHWLVAQITPAQATYLAMLPDQRICWLPGAHPLCITHGVPGRNRVGFYTHQTEAQIAADLADVDEPTLLSAHTHVQIDRHVRTELPTGPRNWHLINPGSVGLPLNSDVRAQFALIENVSDQVEAGGWRATMHRVSYDRRPALAAYAESGMAAVGGVMSELFYWELVTAELEIVFFFRWAKQQGLDARTEMAAAFQAYVQATGRDHYVRARDPLYQQGGQ